MGKQYQMPHVAGLHQNHRRRYQRRVDLLGQKRDHRHCGWHTAASPSATQCAWKHSQCLLPSLHSEPLQCFLVDWCSSHTCIFHWDETQCQGAHVLRLPMCVSEGREQLFSFLEQIAEQDHFARQCIARSHSGVSQCQQAILRE